MDIVTINNNAEDCIALYADMGNYLQVAMQSFHLICKRFFKSNKIRY